MLRTLLVVLLLCMCGQGTGERNLQNIDNPNKYARALAPLAVFNCTTTVLWLSECSSYCNHRRHLRALVVFSCACMQLVRCTTGPHNRTC